MVSETMGNKEETRYKVYPSKWLNLLTAPLNEGDVSGYLEALAGPLVAGLVPPPPPDIVQSLMYYTLTQPSLPTYCPTPLSLLYKITSIHSASTLMAIHSIPSYARRKVDIPSWLVWAAYVEGEEQRAIKRYMRRGEKEGIWGLLWATEETSETTIRVRDKGKGKRRVIRGRRAADEEDEEGDEEDTRKTREISNSAWELLEWLVDLWEKDQESSNVGYSPAFLAQLPKLQDMQIDNPSLPLQIVWSVIHHPSSSREEQRRREDTAGRVMALLVASALPASPPFHPPTLLLSLLPLFRLPTPYIATFLQILSSHIDPSIVSHFIACGIEDLSGIRAQKAAERRKAGTGLQGDFVEGETNPKPRAGYMFNELLLLQDNAKGLGGDGLPTLKVGLVASMLRARGTLNAEDEEWEKTKDKVWRKRFLGCMGQDLGQAMLLLLDQYQ